MDINISKPNPLVLEQGIFTIKFEKNEETDVSYTIFSNYFISVSYLRPIIDEQIIITFDEWENKENLRKLQSLRNRMKEDEEVNNEMCIVPHDDSKDVLDSLRQALFDIFNLWVEVYDNYETVHDMVIYFQYHIALNLLAPEQSQDTYSKYIHMLTCKIIYNQYKVILKMDTELLDCVKKNKIPQQVYNHTKY